MSGFGSRCTVCICICICICIGTAVALSADAAFDRVKAGILANIADSQGVMCMESVERTRYAPRQPVRANLTCGELLSTAAATPRGAAVWHSRLRLNVTAGAEAETFALTDASRFERDDVGGILRTATAGNGEFSSFLRNLISGDGEPFQQTGAGPTLTFGFSVPVEKSHFRFAGGTTAAAYRGSLSAISQSGDLQRLTIEAENAGEAENAACRVQYAIGYKATRIVDREIILPQSSTMDVVNRDGTELRSETYYSGCRRPDPGNPASSTAGTPRPLPANVRLHVRFDPPIDSETAATGDPVIGVIRTTVKDKQNGVIVRAGDRLHGRIALIEELTSPAPRWNLAIAFATIERGVGEHGIDQGVEQPVSLIPIDDGDRLPHDENLGAEVMQRLRPPGGGYFIFHAPGVLLDQKFETEWETR